jgi:enoyl-CoA hydratase
MTFENIILTIDAPVATITFNRPKAMNALNGALLDEFDTAIDQVRDNPEVRVLVLTGAGDKAFVAGADISQLAVMSPLQGKRFSDKGQRIFSKLEALHLPVIAAVNGYALGGGTELALSCDFVYASDKANFGLPEITLGIIPGFGGTQRLARLVGSNMARELVYTGTIFPAAQAKEYGLVNRVVPHESLMEEVMKTARAIAAKGRAALRAAKQAINAGLDVDLETGCRFETDAFALCMSSPDAKEGTGAFLEKRKAVFNGGLFD